ncbi:MAG TPA: dihydrolipoamide acetyltransferase family protein [Fimbriimonas sp.]|nr:dihydrolipoamide acetyltransferase family protein [Fimbriimonas sp.]
MTELIMPKMGDGMEEGTLLEWIKKEGDKVKSGEVIGSIQTDKANLDLEAPASGILSGILLQPGETVPVGKTIGAILKEGESLPANWGSGTASAPAAAATASAEPVAEVSIPESLLNGPVGATQASGTTERVKASPLAKKIAKDLGVDLTSVAGSGPDGRIVQKDVVAASSGSGAAVVTAAAKAPAFATVAATAEDTVVSLNKIRQITAKRTQESKQQVPHFYVTVEVDVEKILALREMFEQEGSGKVSINDFVVKSCALALRDLPQVNSVFQGDKLLQHGGVHVGIAVALEDGLTVPVVKNADQLSLRGISATVKDLAVRAKANKLGFDELSGSTFSISNMGMLDVDNFIAIVNQPNAAILAIASVRKKVVVGEDDEVEIRSRMNITCSFDHRVCDGAVGAKFINIVKSYLENPSRLLA